MDKDDTSKVSFITDFGVFCYLVIAFGLENAGATYQRLVNKIFKDLIGKTMEVYIDDMKNDGGVYRRHASQKP